MTAVCNDNDEFPIVVVLIFLNLLTVVLCHHLFRPYSACSPLLQRWAERLGKRTRHLCPSTRAGRGISSPVTPRSFCPPLCWVSSSPSVRTRLCHGCSTRLRHSVAKRVRVHTVFLVFGPVSQHQSSEQSSTLFSFVT